MSDHPLQPQGLTGEFVPQASDQLDLSDQSLRCRRAVDALEHDLMVLSQLQAELHCELVRFYAGKLQG